MLYFKTRSTPRSHKFFASSFFVLILLSTQSTHVVIQCSLKQFYCLYVVPHFFLLKMFEEIRKSL